MLEWMTRSLKHKAFVLLVIFGILPLLFLGLTANYLFRSYVEQRLHYSGNQSLHNLVLSLTQDLQSFIDLTYTISDNYFIISALKDPFASDQDRKKAFFTLRKEIFKKERLGRVTYPFHYVIIASDETIFTNFWYLAPWDSQSTLSEHFPAGKCEELLNSYSSSLSIEYTNSCLSDIDGDQIYFMKNIIDKLENRGILLIGKDAYSLARMLDNSRLNEYSSVFILDDETGHIIEGESNYYSSETIPANVFTEAFAFQEPVRIVNFFGKKHVVFAQRLSLFGLMRNLIVLILIPLSSIYKEVVLLNFITYGVIAISICAMLSLIYLVTQRIVRPIIIINEKMTAVQMGQFETQSDIDRKDEIGQLSRGFNVMVHNLEEYIQEIKEEEKFKSQLEMRILQSQIRPHFIRNTLNTIRWMAEIKGARNISRALTSFSRLIDYTIAGTSALVPVREELTYLDEYLFLQNIRFQNKFVVDMDIDNAILDFLILKLSIQPVVENSIIHGFSHKSGRGELRIQGKQENSQVTFTIIDNGVGMDTATVQRILDESEPTDSFQQHNAIGLANIQKRMRLHFGKNYSIRVESEKGIGTKVFLPFPVLSGPKQGNAP